MTQIFIFLLLPAILLTGNVTGICLFTGKITDQHVEKGAMHPKGTKPSRDRATNLNVIQKLNFKSEIMLKTIEATT